MKVRRKPIYYEAEQVGDKWLVTNLFTKEVKEFTDRDFRAQFEPTTREKKTEPIPEAPLSTEKPLGLPAGEVMANRRRAEETAKETAMTPEERKKLANRVRDWRIRAFGGDEER